MNSPKGFQLEKKQAVAASGILHCQGLTLKNCLLRLCKALASPPANMGSPGTKSHFDINPNEISLRRWQRGHMTHAKAENNKKNHYNDYSNALLLHNNNGYH